MVHRLLVPLLLLWVSVAGAQTSGAPHLELSVPARVVARVDAPTTVMSSMLLEGHRRELLNSGWPAAMHCRVELWRKGMLFFGRESVVEWDVVVEYAPATRTYIVRRYVDGRIEELGEARTIEEADRIVGRAFRVALTPRSSGRQYYYTFRVDLATLSLSDLDAWQRWVRGEAEPAVQGKKSPATAVQRGLGSLFSRVLGGETQTYERKSGVFRAG